MKARGCVNTSKSNATIVTCSPVSPMMMFRRFSLHPFGNESYVKIDTEKQMIPLKHSVMDVCLHLYMSEKQCLADITS